MKQILKKILYSIYPQTCHLCKKIIEADSAFCHDCWNQLDFITDPFCDTCGIALPYIESFDKGETLYCSLCLQAPPIYEKCRSAVQYSQAVQKLIVGFKQYDQTATLPVFTAWLKKLCSQFDRIEDHILIPIPIHYIKMFNRHYNQAALLSKALAKETGCRTWLNGMIRTKHTKPQGKVRITERASNVKGAFAINLKYKNQIKGKAFILIDDVYTSGSTVNECTKLLLNEGAKHVKILTIARTIKQ